jgi:hypothetical protein
MKRLVLIAAVTAGTLLASPASADIRLVTNNMLPQTSNLALLLDLNGALAGAQQTLTFTTTVPNSIARIIFNAECALGAVVSPASYVDIDVRVRPAGAPAFVTLPPTLSDNAFCSANQTLGSDGRVSAAVQAYVALPAVGAHQIQVGARPVGGGNWWIDDLSLVVDTE